MSDARRAHDRQSHFVWEATKKVGSLFGVLTGIPGCRGVGKGVVEAPGTPYRVRVSSATHLDKVREQWVKAQEGRVKGIIPALVLYSRWDAHPDEARVIVRFDDFCALVEEHYEALRRAGRVNNEKE